MGRRPSTASAAGQPRWHTQGPGVRWDVWTRDPGRPVPQLGPPGQTLGTGAPQVTAAGSAVHAGTHAHTPFMHDVPDAHRTPQPPQLAPSVAVRTHAPLQRVDPVGQVQRPPTQVVPLGQALLHAPQLAPPVWVFTQRPLQSD